MHRKVALFVVSFLVAFGVLARDTRKELTVDLRFVPQEGVQSNSPDLTPGVLERTVALQVEDGRGLEVASTVGQGTNDDDQTFPIRASTDLIAFLKDTAGQLATGWGLKVSERPDRVLTLRVTRFFVDESNKALGSVYAAEVKLTYVLADGAGKSCWRARHREALIAMDARGARTTAMKC
jgi:hypothetical protein